jgi:signal transduction histidine kinase
VVSLIVRARRAEGEERQQIRLIAWVAAAVAALLAINVAVGVVTLPWHPSWIEAFNEIVWSAIMLLVVVGMPVTVAIAILKYRLFEIDVVVRKTIVYGSLALFTTVVYVVVVVIVGRAIGAQQGSLALSVAATAVVAVAFQPVREAFERLADRLVYGRRASPYEVLARFSDRVGGAYAIDDVLPRIARVLGEGVRAERATVWLRLGDGFVPSAGWPDPLEGAKPERTVGLEEIHGDHVAPVRYLDEVLGALAVTKPRDEPLTTEDLKLVDDLAAQAGLVLANVRMTADLEARLASIQTQALELRASRQRIVAAQDTERRRLERNIHDGAQQHLVAMAVRLRLVRGVLAADPQKARTMLGELEGQIDDALETLRGLSAGIYPPLLQDEGPAAALADHARSAPVPVTIEAGPPERHPIELEAAIYFCVLEGLQNATKYAAASAIAIELGSTETSVWFEVRDDGVGFDPSATLEGTGLAGMRDRLAVLGGRVTLRSRPGEGTSVRGEVPLGVRTVVGVGGAP